MKNRTKPFFFLLLLLLVAGCQKETYHVAEEFTVGFHEKAYLVIDGNQHEIVFSELMESRCPLGANCYVEGSVAVKLKVNTDTELILGNGLDYSSTVEFQNHNIHLLEVKYDKDSNYGKKWHYSVKLRID